MIQTKNLFLKLILTSLLSIVNLQGTIDYLDTTFGPDANGIVKTTIGTSAQANGLTINSNGKIIAVGQTSDVGGNSYITVARYNVDGSLDTGFNSTGVNTFATAGTLANAVAVDGANPNNIYVAGGNNAGNILVAKYTNAGTLDNTFGSSGVATLSIGDAGIANAILIDANNKVVVVGSTISNGQSHMFIARLNTNGSFDTGFNTTGYRTITGSSHYTGTSVRLDANAKIVAGGSASAGSGTDFLVVRLNTDGSFDTGFNSTGIVTTAISGSDNDSVQSIAIDSNNKIIASGYVSVSGNNQCALVRYNTDGTLDTTFGTGGTGIVTEAIGTNSHIWASLIDQSGKIVVTGDSDNHFVTARYTANGSLDTTFGTNGIQTTTIGSGSQAFAASLQSSDGRVVVAGYDVIDPVNGYNQFALVRFNKNNTDFVNLTSIADNSTINTKIPTVSGTSSAASATVQVVVNGVQVATPSTDGSGNWNAGSTINFNPPTGLVLPVGSNTIQTNLVVSSVVVVSHVTKFTVTDNMSEDCVFAFNSGNQVKSSSAFSALPFDNTILLGTWGYSANVFTCRKTGRYIIEYVGHPGTTGLLTSGNVSTALFIDGTEYVGGECNSTIDLGANTSRVLSKAIIKDLNSGQQITLRYAVNSSGNAGLIANSNASGTQHAYSLVINRIN